jgi:hypothetical protein
MIEQQNADNFTPVSTMYLDTMSLMNESKKRQKNNFEEALKVS